MGVKVRVGSILHDYTGGRSQVSAKGSTVAEVLADLDMSFPGLRFRIIDEQDRIRPHIRVFLGQEPVKRLGQKLPPNCVVHVLGALSGG